MTVPKLVDEVIGYIFSHLVPGKGLWLQSDSDADTQTLKSCALVSRQFGFWSRRNLYRQLRIRKSFAVSHYLDLFRRYPDMPSHIKVLRVMIMDEIWGQGGQEPIKGFIDLASLLNRLSKESAVDRAYFQLHRGWDHLRPSLQDSILRFILSRTFDTLELGGFCQCFPPIFIPFVWTTKRFHLSKYKIWAIQYGDGEWYPACPNWQNERRKLGPNAPVDRERNEKHGELLSKALIRLHHNPSGHPAIARLESLWLVSDTASMFLEESLYNLEENTRIRSLRELHFTHLDDGDIPAVARLLEGCQDTLESLIFSDLAVRSATSSNLPLLTNIDLPRLRSLVISTHTSDYGVSTKSLAWYLLHARRAKKFRLDTLNLIFLDVQLHAAFLTPEGCVRNSTIIRKLFETFKFFKLEKIITDLLTPEGKAGLWFMMSSFAAAVEDVLVEEALAREFPNLVEAKRITHAIGQFDEAPQITEALSMFPEGPALTRHQRSIIGDKREGNMKEEFFRPMMNEFRRTTGLQM